MPTRKYTTAAFPREDQEERLRLMEWRIRNGLNPSDGLPMPEEVREELVHFVLHHDDSKSRKRRGR